MFYALKQSWASDSVKHAFLICDAPAHGKDVNQGHIDNFPNGHPEGYIIQDLTKEFADKNINFTMVKVNKDCDQMIGVLQAVYKKSGKTLNVTDLADAVKNLSQAEITKKFVEGMSFMLSTTLGSGKTASGSVGRPVKRTTQPLWDPK